MDFKSFLIENTADIKFISFDKFGYVTVNINGKKYVYYGDAAYIPKIWQKAKYTPGAALNDLKKYAKLIESPPKMEPVTTQQDLF